MMKHLTSFSFLIFIFGLILSSTLEVNAAAPGSETGGIQQAEPTDQDREYYASMIRFGKEAFQRGATWMPNSFSARRSKPTGPIPKPGFIMTEL